MIDIESFLALREVVCPDVTVNQIRQWYKHFIPTVQKYDDKINNHLKYTRDRNNTLTVREVSALRSYSSSNRTLNGRSNMIEVDDTAVESEFNSGDEDEATMERNRISTTDLINFSVQLCLQQTQTQSTQGKKSLKGGSQKNFGNGRRKFSGKGKGRAGRSSTQKGSKGGGGSSQAPRSTSNGNSGGRKASLIRPMAGKNRF